MNAEEVAKKLGTPLAFVGFAGGARVTGDVIDSESTGGGCDSVTPAGAGSLGAGTGLEKENGNATIGGSLAPVVSC